MALFASRSACETRCKDMMKQKVWVVAHMAVDRLGKTVARFIRYMSPANPGHGSWSETDQDNQT